MLLKLAFALQQSDRLWAAVFDWARAHLDGSAALGIGDVVVTVHSRRSAFTSETSRPRSFTSWTVYVSSFSRRPTMMVPSFVTARTGRLIGRMAPVGSSRDRCSAAAERVRPISVRSGPEYSPLSWTR